MDTDSMVRLKVTSGSSQSGCKRAKAAKARCRCPNPKPGKVDVKYVLVSPEAGRWELLKDDWTENSGEVYYQCVKVCG